MTLSKPRAGRLPRWRWLALLLVATVAVVATWLAWPAPARPGPRHLTAYFSRTVGLYSGSSVRILGVKVGRIDSLRPVGRQVRVTMSLDGENRLPRGVRAVVIPPSLVSDRYVELQPAYTSGPTLRDGAVLGVDRTQVPLEYDEVFRDLDRLNRALGPGGANRSGALARLVRISARNLRGNGVPLHAALSAFSNAVATLSGSRQDLFGTVTRLQQFTTTLAQDDGGVRRLNLNLSRVGSQLAGERRDLGAALGNLAVALRLVHGFVADNRGHLTADIHRLTRVSRVLRVEKAALSEVVDLSGEGLSNLDLATDSRVARQQRVHGVGVAPLDTKTTLTRPITGPSDPSLTCAVLDALAVPLPACRQR